MSESRYEDFVQLFTEHGFTLNLFGTGFSVNVDDELSEFITKMYWSQKFLSMQDNNEAEKYPSFWEVSLRNKDELITMFICLHNEDYNLCGGNIMFSSLCNKLKRGLIINEAILYEESIEELFTVMETILKIYSYIK